MNKNIFSVLFLSVAISAGASITNIEDSNNELSLLVHKTPTCGCCKMWVEHIKENGFIANIKDHHALLCLQ